MGVATWPMAELEADDALASAAYIAAQDPMVEKLCICHYAAQRFELQSACFFQRGRDSITREGQQISRYVLLSVY